MYGPPEETKWAINGSKIDFKVHRGGISIRSIKRTLSTTTRLTILKVQHADAGSYECQVNWDKNRIDKIAKRVIRHNRRCKNVKPQIFKEGRTPLIKFMV